LQQIFSRMSPVTLADLHKGGAVMIVATEGTPFERQHRRYSVKWKWNRFLQAAPNASEAMMLTPWSLGGMPAGCEGGNQ
jgi:hypothetical protein